MAKRQIETVRTTVADAVSTAYSAIEELAGELREWYDGMHENFQAGEKGSAVDEAATALEGIEEPEAPEGLGELAAEFRQLPLVKRPSRKERLSHALDYATAAMEALDVRLSELQDEHDTLTDESTPETDANKARVLEIEAERDDLQAYHDEIEAMVDEADAVEFPAAR